MLMGAAAGVVRDSGTFVALGSDRSGLDSIARLFRSNSLIEHLPENTISQGVLLFGGTAVAATDGDGFHHSNPEAYEISYYGADGALRRITRLLREPQPVTSAELDAYRARSTRRSGRSRADTPARVHATLDMLIVDGAGRLWAHEAARDAQTATPWWVFDDHGSLLGSVMIPATCRPMDIGADYLLCARTGAGEEPQVALHSMSPP